MELFISKKGGSVLHFGFGTWLLIIGIVYVGICLVNPDMGNAITEVIANFSNALQGITK